MGSGIGNIEKKSDLMTPVLWVPSSFLVFQAQVSTAHLPVFHDLVGWTLCNFFSVIKDQQTVRNF